MMAITHLVCLVLSEFMNTSLRLVFPYWLFAITHFFIFISSGFMNALHFANNY